MKKLLYKEFKLTISAVFYLVPLLGALVLIPQWPYFIALMYCFFITIPNIFTIAKSQNDIGFSVMLPVQKRDVVKARVLSVVVLELLHILVAVIFAGIRSLYSHNNYLLDLNFAFFGFAFIMFAVYNLIFLPMFYKTAYKIAAPAITAFAGALIIATGAELLVLFVPAAKILDSTTDMLPQLPVLIGGIAIFVLANVIAYKISARKFEQLDL